MIKNKLNLINNKIYARKTILKEVSSKDSILFLNDNHLQGASHAKYRYGLYYKNELVSLITITSKGEIKRFCSKINTNIIGGFSKLFKYTKHLIKYTYVDLDWSSLNPNKNIYYKYFNKVSPTSVGYWWTNKQSNIRENRIKYQKHKLIKKGWGKKEQTEDEIMYSKKYLKIYNTGNLKYENLK